jgi:hypothetical protein
MIVLIEYLYSQTTSLYVIYLFVIDLEIRNQLSDSVKSP